jgi:hypothetical protein
MSKTLIFTIELIVGDASISSEELASKQSEIKLQLEAILGYQSSALVAEMSSYGIAQDVEVTCIELREKYDTRQ